MNQKGLARAIFHQEHALKIFLSLAICFLLCGCSSNDSENRTQKEQSLNFVVNEEKVENENVKIPEPPKEKPSSIDY